MFDAARKPNYTTITLLDKHLGLQRKEWNVNKYKIFILYADDTVGVNLIYHIEIQKNTRQ